MTSFPLSSRLASEALGTALLVATVVGSGTMADRLTTDTALALLANTLATGAILVVLITILGPISGAHFNPVVSLVFALRRELTAMSTLAYIGAQILGGVAGTLLAHAMFGLPLLQVSTTIRTGSAQWLAEVTATFGLVFVILAGLRFRADAVAWLVGLYITAAYWFTASTSFASCGRYRPLADEHLFRHPPGRSAGFYCRRNPRRIAGELAADGSSQSSITD